MVAKTFTLFFPLHSNFVYPSCLISFAIHVMGAPAPHCSMPLLAQVALTLRTLRIPGIVMHGLLCSNASARSGIRAF